MTFPDHLITQDRLAVALERQIIARYTRDAATVLDVGCGTGETMRWLAERRCIPQSFVGVDPLGWIAAPDCLIHQSYRDEAGTTDILIVKGDHTTITGQYDCIYTQRMLIQLPTLDEQLAAIQRLRVHLAPNGRLVCVEPSRPGLGRLNAMRLHVGLPAIEPPAHTNYLPALWQPHPGLLSQATFGQSYSFLSRVVEAYRAQQEGREPIYMDLESLEGQLCLRLPETGECFGQYHYSVWGPA